MTRPDDYLVRVSRELLDKLVADDSEPVVILRVEDLGDGTHSIQVRAHECPGVPSPVERWMSDAMDRAATCPNPGGCGSSCPAPKTCAHLRSHQ